jgi:putative transposase
VDEANAAGARLVKCTGVLGISLRTYQRWKKEGEDSLDKRRGATRPRPAHALSAAETKAVLDACHSERFSSLPPTQIVPTLADQGVYLASESSFYRILRAHEENQRRQRAKPPDRREPPAYPARAPLEIWVTDISWLRGPSVGVFYFLYFVMDLFSRKIVGWEVYENESSAHLARVVSRATIAEGGCAPIRLHSDNGSPMKGTSLLQLCYDLGIVATNSRPRVSDDNPHIEALFRTTKYWPGYPWGGFADLDAARRWIESFVDVYNHHHLHSGLGYLSPETVHSGAHHAVLKARTELYAQAMAANPARWVGRVTRNWSLQPVVWTTTPSKSILAREGLG